MPVEWGGSVEDCGPAHHFPYCSLSRPHPGQEVPGSGPRPDSLLPWPSLVRRSKLWMLHSSPPPPPLEDLRAAASPVPPFPRARLRGGKSGRAPIPIPLPMPTLFLPHSFVCPGCCPILRRPVSGRPWGTLASHRFARDDLPRPSAPAPPALPDQWAPGRAWGWVRLWGGGSFPSHPSPRQ